MCSFHFKPFGFSFDVAVYDKVSEECFYYIQIYVAPDVQCEFIPVVVRVRRDPLYHIQLYLHTALDIDFFCPFDQFWQIFFHILVQITESNIKPLAYGNLL